MNHKQILQRFFHFNNYLRNSINKNNLSKLRKKTGYTFSNCKKALDLNNNDLNLAEKWLKEQALAMGWAKATKLEGRTTLQGLIGVGLNHNGAILMEINCETDFVARNKTFESFVEFALDNCLKHYHEQNGFITAKSLIKMYIDDKELKSIKCNQDKKTLGDHAAMVISKLGENINLRRAIYVNAAENLFLMGCSHPSKLIRPTQKIYFGKYGAILAYKSQINDDTIEQVARQLCQHVIGMNPIKIGNQELDKPMENKDDENVMIYQDFLIDPTITVGELINDLNIDIVDFIRFECGEQVVNELNNNEQHEVIGQQVAN